MPNPVFLSSCNFMSLYDLGLSDQGCFKKVVCGGISLSAPGKNSFIGRLKKKVGNKIEWEDLRIVQTRDKAPQAATTTTTTTTTKQQQNNNKNKQRQWEGRRERERM